MATSGQRPGALTHVKFCDWRSLGLTRAAPYSPFGCNFILHSDARHRYHSQNRSPSSSSTTKTASVRRSPGCCEDAGNEVLRGRRTAREALQFLAGARPGGHRALRHQYARDGRDGAGGAGADGLAGRAGAADQRAAAADGARPFIPKPFRWETLVRAIRCGRRRAATRRWAGASRRTLMATELATLGGGCFWCLEPLFMSLRGVQRSVSGYAGGHVPNPTYEMVCGKRTGHAEVVQLTFDPEQISYADILRVFFTMHDPTTKDRQGNDVGPQYRSIILTHSDAQAQTAREVHGRDRARARLAGPDRDRDRAARGVLAGRGGAPGLLQPQSVERLLPGGDPARRSPSCASSTPSS